MEQGDVARARAHRSGLSGVTFVAITGSCGKTTTKDLAAGLLSPVFEGTSNPGSGNCGADLVRHILSVEPHHKFCLQELGAWGPGTLDAGLEIVRPDVGVVLNVRRDHIGHFHGLEQTQAEKAKVVERLPPAGTAILNADDPNVARMRSRTPARVLTFGMSDTADFRLDNVHSAWPERLSFDVWFRGERRSVCTQLLGEHLAGSAAAALAIAHTLGMDLDDAIPRLADLPPTARRMSPFTTNSGVAVVRDDFKAPSDSMDELLRFVSRARAARKVLVVGRISDYPGRSRALYTSFALAAAAVVDLLVFVGERPEDLWGGDRRGAPDFLGEFTGRRGRVELFRTVCEASDFLRRELGPDDLVMLKGSGASDHLERIVLGPRVQCWRTHCGRIVACDSCELREIAAGPDDELP